MAGTIVQEAVQKWEARLEELRPSVEEASEIEDALKAMGHTTRQTRGRRSGGGNRGRRNGGRRDEFVKLVQENPGITVGDAAKAMKINPNYLYRVAKDAVADKAVKKEGQGYVPAATRTRGNGNGNGGGNGD